MLLIPTVSRGTVAAVSEDHMVTMAALRLISLYTIVVLLSTVGMYALNQYNAMVFIMYMDLLGIRCIIPQ